MTRSKHFAALACLILALFAAAPARSAAIRAGSSPAAAATPSPSIRAVGDRMPMPEGDAVVRPSDVATPERKVTAYTLPPELYAKARNLATIEDRLYLIDIAWSIAALLIILRARLAPKIRDAAERITQNHFLQAAIFAPALLITLDILQLPPALCGHWLSRSYGLSVQGWKSWARDWALNELLVSSLAILLVWILYVLIRRSPRRWWFHFWLAALPIMLFIFFVSPWVIEPLFDKFEPLQLHHPELVLKLEQVVQRGGMTIPPDRMFAMNASAKVTELNAYVTGFGASKRVVVWDTTMAKMNTPQIAAVFGHEMGHYVLHHISKGLIFFALLLLLFFYLARVISGRIIRRRGLGLGIRGEDDWASLPVFLLVLTLLSFPATPLANAFTRNQEHQADIYALEVTHGLNPDSSQVAAQMFQILGEVDLDDPDPSALVRFWLYSHPSIGDRVDLALHYQPWDNGQSPRFVK